MVGWISYYGYRIVYSAGLHIPEHRLIMEKYIARKLLSTEHVHHKDGDRLNNSINNLELMDRRLHGSIEGLKARGIPKLTLRKQSYNKCKECLKYFLVIDGRHDQIFCSNECYHKYKKGKPLDPKNLKAIRNAYKRKKEKR